MGEPARRRRNTELRTGNPDHRFARLKNVLCALVPRSLGRNPLTPTPSENMHINAYGPVCPRLETSTTACWAGDSTPNSHALGTWPLRTAHRGPLSLPQTRECFEACGGRTNAIVVRWRRANASALSRPPTRAGGEVLHASVFTCPGRSAPPSKILLVRCRKGTQRSLTTWACVVCETQPLLKKLLVETPLRWAQVREARISVGPSAPSGGTHVPACDDHDGHKNITSHQQSSQLKAERSAPDHTQCESPRCSYRCLRPALRARFRVGPRTASNIHEFHNILRSQQVSCLLCFCRSQLLRNLFFQHLLRSLLQLVDERPFIFRRRFVILE